MVMKRVEIINSFLENIRVKGVVKTDDVELFRLFLSDDHVHKRVKNVITYRSFCVLVRRVCKRKHYSFCLSEGSGYRRCYVYDLIGN